MTKGDEEDEEDEERDDEPPIVRNPNPTNSRQPLRDEPVKIRAASLELREKDKMATFTGDVYVLQGDTEMRCKVLVVSYEAETDTRTANAPIGADVQIGL
jgi:lipopolysaccharide export system protein LptA